MGERGWDNGGRVGGKSRVVTNCEAQLQGIVERLTYHSEESGYTVARLKVSRTGELVTIVGKFAEIQLGQTLQLQGGWHNHPKYGPQFQVSQSRETLPDTIAGIEKYLGSGLIKGVGPVTAKRIVDRFGLETLTVIKHQIERLAEVPGIGPKRAQMIQAAWSTQQSIQAVMLFLQNHGVATTYAVKIYKQYGEEAIEIVTRNPYQLTRDIYGIGFVTADQIARSLGIPLSAEFRSRSGILHSLSAASEAGHCFLPRSELIDRVIQQLATVQYQPDPATLEPLIEKMAREGELVLERGTGCFAEQVLCYSPPFYGAEYKLAEKLLMLRYTPLEVDQARVQRWIDRLTATANMQLSEPQRRAVEVAATERVTILTGGPGCGKTFTTRTIVALWKAMGKSIALAAPTGRAAQRLSELTGQDAKTLHRLLEFDPKELRFKRDPDHPLEIDAIVVDEASMLDLFLAHALLRALPPTAQLLFVGDINQLPSVGPGTVLQDLIASQQFPVVNLTQVFRQAQHSQIVTHAHAINQGELPTLEPVSHHPQSDCLWLSAPQPEQGIPAIRDLITALIPELGFNIQTDVQVLCPMTKGAIGTRHLNSVLQDLINPLPAGQVELERGNSRLRIGDRVIQQVNNYDKEVFNGDLGTIAAIDLETPTVTVQFNARLLTYDATDLNEIALAWCITIHKSQGGEFPVIILPLYRQHYPLLSRNLLYTGLTRAKQLAILVGSQQAITTAVQQVKAQQRYTQLDRRMHTD